MLKFFHMLGRNFSVLYLLFKNGFLLKKSLGPSSIVFHMFTRNLVCTPVLNKLNFCIT
jgi:hypothetical protein